MPFAPCGRRVVLTLLTLALLLSCSDTWQSAEDGGGNRWGAGGGEGPAAAAACTKARRYSAELPQALGNARGQRKVCAGFSAAAAEPLRQSPSAPAATPLHPCP